VRNSTESMSLMSSDPFEDKYEKAKTFEEKKIKNYKRNIEHENNK